MFNKKFTVIHFTLLFLSLLYSFKFYKNISIELAVMAVLFDIIVPTLFITAVESKKEKRIVFTVLVSILIMFNLLAISSSFINNYNKQSAKKIINTEYAAHQEKLKQLKVNLDNIQNELNNYPSLSDYTKNSPKWEDKTGLNNSWSQGKQDLNNKLAAAAELYNKELSIKSDKYKTIKNDIGYNQVFETISTKINIKSRNLVLILYLLFAVMLQILIFYTKSLSVKEFKNYKKSHDEITKEMFEDFTNKIFNERMKMIESNLFNINDNAKEKIKIIVDDTAVEPKQEFNQIEPVAEPAREELKEVEEIKFNKFKEDPLVLDDYKKYFECCKENLKGEFTPGIKKIAESLHIPVGKAQRIFNALKDKKYLRVENLKTKLIKDEFNSLDFKAEKE